MHGIDRCVLGDSSRAAGHTPVQCVDVTARSVDASCPHLPAFQACVESERPAHRVRPRCRHLDDGRLGPSPPSGHHVTGRGGRTNVEPGLAVVDDESVRHPTATAGSPRSSTSSHRRRCPPCFTRDGDGHGHRRIAPGTALLAAQQRRRLDRPIRPPRRPKNTDHAGHRGRAVLDLTWRHQGSASPTAGSSGSSREQLVTATPTAPAFDRHHQCRPPQLAAKIATETDRRGLRRGTRTTEAGLFSGSPCRLVGRKIARVLGFSRWRPARAATWHPRIWLNQGRLLGLRLRPAQLSIARSRDADYRRADDAEDVCWRRAQVCSEVDVDVQIGANVRGAAGACEEFPTGIEQRQVCDSWE